MMSHSMITLSFVFVMFSSLCLNVLSCSNLERDSLLSFYQHISSPRAAPLNWSSTDCCQWEGISCRNIDGRVTSVFLAGRGLSGIISSSLLNLSSLAYLNLSQNQLSGNLPLELMHDLNNLQTVDLSSNQFNGSIDPSFLRRASNLISFNVSNNNFHGPIPSSVCAGSPLVEILDFSRNEFAGSMLNGIGECSKLQVLRAGFNSLTGWIPYDLYSLTTLKEISLSNNHLSGPINSSIVMLSNLKILELHVNELSGGLPDNIGLLSSLEQLQLHTNSLNGTLPLSLTNCSNLTTLLLRNNHFGGEIDTLDFSKLKRLQAIDLGNNSFVGNIPSSLCYCSSITAIRLAYNKLVGEVPPCMASLKLLVHLSLSNNYLSNVVGALKTLMQCDNLTNLFMTSCFIDELMPDDGDLSRLMGFQNLEILSLAGSRLKGTIPSWLAKLRKLKVLNLSYNQISGPIPTWLGSMPKLFEVDFTQNSLTGEFPREVCRLQALIADNSSLDVSYLPLPFLFDNNQYNRLLNLPPLLRVGNNSLSGNIPAEIGRLKLLHVLDLSYNNFNGSIPDQLSNLVNLEILDMSGNHLSGEIPESLTGMHFLSSFNVAKNDLQGDIPTGAQFDTFPATAFEGNPKLCGNVVKKSCTSQVDAMPDEEEKEEDDERRIPFGVGYFVGFFAVSITLLFHSSCKV